MDSGAVVRKAARAVFYGIGVLVLLFGYIALREPLKSDLPWGIGLTLAGAVIIGLAVRARAEDAEFYQRAGTMQRFTNFVIDTQLVNSAVLIFFIRLRVIDLGLTRDNYLFIILGVTLALFLVYYVLFESLFQRTIAKFLTGTRVVTDDGGRPAVSSITLRTLIRFIPFEALSIFMQAGMWHDNWVKTSVVRD